MKKMIMLIFAVSIPVFYFLQVWEVTRYNDLQKKVAELEFQQETGIDQNKKILAGISLYKSPERIDKLAREELKLKPVGQNQITIINVGTEGRN